MASHDGRITIKGWDATDRQLELLKKYGSNEVRRGINEIIADATEKYIPNDTGALASNVTIQADRIVYNSPYAHYQWIGEIYGRNFIGKEVDDDGNIVGVLGWRSKRGKGVKYPTGRMIGEQTGVYHDYATNTDWPINGYTTDGTGPYWTYTMWKNEANRVQNQITGYLIRLDNWYKKRGRGK